VHRVAGTGALDKINAVRQSENHSIGQVKRSKKFTTLDGQPKEI
jgi:hypothetical protein